MDPSNTPTAHQIDEALRGKNTEPLKQYLDAGGRAQALCAALGFPLYRIPAVIGDLHLLKRLFSDGMQLDKNNSFFGCVDTMPDEVFEWAISQDFDKAEIDQDCSNLAYQVSHPARFKRLVERGADVREPIHKRGGHPLIMLAAYRGAEEVVRFMVAAGADINADFQDGWKPIHEVMCFVQDAGRLEFMISMGADVKARYKGRTLVMLGAQGTNPDMSYSLDKIKLLYSMSDDWSGEEDDEGNTALHHAAKTNISTEIIDFLLSKGSDPMKKNKAGLSPLEISISKDTPVRFRPFFDYLYSDKFDAQGAFPCLGEMCDQAGAENIKKELGQWAAAKPGFGQAAVNN